MLQADDELDPLIPLLVQAIQMKVAAKKFSEPLSCLRILYYDTHAPEAYINLGALTARKRQTILDEKGRNALYYIWAAAEESTDVGAGHLGTKEAGGELANHFAHIYAMLAEDEEVGMKRYRRMLQQVAMRLNGLDWKSQLAVTDDFVVATADGSQFFGGDDFDDLSNSISASQLALLRERGLLGPGEDWSRRPGFPDPPPSEADLAITRMVGIASALPEQERIGYWVAILDQMASGTEVELKQAGVNAYFPIRGALQIGNHAVAPLLRFALKWADKPEWVVDAQGKRIEMTPMSEPVGYLFQEIRTNGYGDAEIESLLRQFIVQAVRFNEGLKGKGLNPVLAARCLHELCSGYPEPIDSGDNELMNAQAFVAGPAAAVTAATPAAPDTAPQHAKKWWQFWK